MAVEKLSQLGDGILVPVQETVSKRMLSTHLNIDSRQTGRSEELK